MTLPRASGSQSSSSPSSRSPDSFQLQLPPLSSSHLRVVMVGDVVGKPGMQIVTAGVNYLRNVVKADAVVVNAENAADGSGLRLKDYRKLVEAGVDAITLGDHVFRKREIMSVLDSESNIVRAANLAAAAPGKGLAIIKIGTNDTIAVMSALGRVFMNPIDCPFRALDECIKQSSGTKIRLVDFHAEATSDMQLMGRYLDGRVTAVLGTHTHVPTADECVLPGGTGFQCDVGMTGPHESILGRKIDAVREAVINAVPTQFQVATQDVRLTATWFDAVRQTGKCTQIGRIQVTADTIDAYNAATHQR